MINLGYELHSIEIQEFELIMKSNVYRINMILYNWEYQSFRFIFFVKRHLPLTLMKWLSRSMCSNKKNTVVRVEKNMWNVMPWFFKPLFFSFSFSCRLHTFYMCTKYSILGTYRHSFNDNSLSLPSFLSVLSPSFWT